MRFQNRRCHQFVTVPENVSDRRLDLRGVRGLFQQCHKSFDLSYAVRCPTRPREVSEDGELGGEWHLTLPWMYCMVAASVGPLSAGAVGGGALC